MPEPTKIPRPFADSGDKNSIPDSSGGIGFASWQEGFPAITSEPFAQGGVAPKRADFNGIFNALSLATVWQQQGGVYAYDATTNYEVGNIVEYSGDLYKCLVANGPSSAIIAPTDTTVWSGLITAAKLSVLLTNYAKIEEGTWTPLIYGGTTAGTIINTSNSSYYIRLGDLVFLRFYFTWKITSAPTGDVMISGVPYTFDSYYPGLAGSNNHICNIANAVGSSTNFRLRSYTPTTSQLANITWSSGSNTYNVWNNAVNASDTTLGWILYRTSA